VGRLDEPGEGVSRIGHISDLHLRVNSRSDGQALLVERWLRAFDTGGAEAVAISGDLVESKNDLKTMEVIQALLESWERRSGLTTCVVPGNHDVWAPGTRDSPGHRQFSRAFDTEYPTLKSSSAVDFLLVDSNLGSYPEHRAPDRPGVGGGMYVFPTYGWVGGDQLAQLESMLSKTATGRFRVLVMHHHLVQQERLPFGESVKKGLDGQGKLLMGHMSPAADAASVRRWAVTNGVGLILHGHKHRMMRGQFLDGDVLVLNAGSSTRPPLRARLIDLHPDGTRVVWELDLTS